ncbi:MAG: guanylate kinase [bacterium]
MTKRGLLFVISGPSGTGKGTILEQVFGKNSNVRFSVSATTRTPRPGERDGEHYFFISTEKFQNMIKDGAFLEWAQVHNAFYGTPADFVDRTMASGFDCILDIDVQGALQVMKKRSEAAYVFVAPPDLVELRSRLLKRGTENEAQIEERVETAKWELTKIAEYDYLVVNNRLDEAVKQVEAILQAENCTVPNMGEEIKRLAGVSLSLGKE